MSTQLVPSAGCRTCGENKNKPETVHHLICSTCTWFLKLLRVELDTCRLLQPPKSPVMVEYYITANPVNPRKSCLKRCAKRFGGFFFPRLCYFFVFFYLFILFFSFTPLRQRLLLHFMDEDAAVGSGAFLMLPRSET